MASSRQLSTASASEHYALWSIQDSLLQYYRTMFITAQSILISVGVSVSSGSKPESGFMLVILGGFVLIVWLSVTWSRSRDVTFAQRLLLQQESGHTVAGLLSTFKEYQAHWGQHGSYRIVYSDGTGEDFVPESIFPDFGTLSFWRWGTRSMLEFLLPLVFLLCWLFLLLRLLQYL